MKSKDVEKIVQRLLNDVKDQYTDEEYGLALFKAISTKQPKIVRSLLAAGAPANIFYKGKTCLHLAMEKNDPDLVRLLLEHGASNLAKDGEKQIPPGKTPIGLAASLRHWQCVEAIAKIPAVNKDDKDEYGFALFKAIDNAAFAQNAIEILLAADASTTFCHKGKTCLDLAIERNHFGLVRKLLQHGAYSLAKDGEKQIPPGKTPIGLAASLGHWLCVNTIAMFSAVGKDEYDLVLFKAISANTSEASVAIRSLLDAGASTTFCHKGKTCLDLARKQNRPELVQLLLTASIKQAERRPVTSNNPGPKVLDDDFYLIDEEKDVLANSILETGPTYEAEGKLDKAICHFMQAIDEGHSKAAYDALRDFLYRLSTNTQDSSFDSIPKQTLIDAIKKLSPEEQLFLFKEQCLIRKTSLGKRMWKKEEDAFLKCGLGRDELKDICVYIKNKLDPKFSIEEIEAINSSKSTTGSIFFGRAESNRYDGKVILNDVMDEKIFGL